MEFSADLIVGSVFYGAMGYLGGWFFKGDGNLKERYGFLLAFFITYVVFIMEVFASAQISDMKNWTVTLTFTSAFIYRFFLHRG